MSGLLILGLLTCVPIVTSTTPMLILSELCYHKLNIEYIQQQTNNSFKMVPPEEFCGDTEKMLHVFIEASNGPVVGSLAAGSCSPAHVIASFTNASLFTWNCLSKERNGNHSGRLSPSVGHVAAVLSRMVLYMKWKSVAIISSNEGWWPSLAQSFDSELRAKGIIPRHLFIVEENAKESRILEKFESLRRNPCRAIIICASANDVGRRILETLDTLSLARDHNTLSVLTDVATLPSWQHSFQQNESFEFSSNVSDFMNKISSFTTRNLVVFGEKENFYFNSSIESVIVRKLRQSLEVFKGRFLRSSDFVLCDIKDSFLWRILLLVSDNELTVMKENLEEWSEKHLQKDECDECDDSDIDKIVNILLIFGSVCLFLGVIYAGVALARRQLMKKSVTKGPYKVLLTASDFVFPQIADTRRVDEGIEAMLCCWLQQLQEFGGPEIDKPDLLQNSSSSMRTPLRTNSSPNLAKQLIVDPRVRYNGDFVQMKPLPSGANGTEVKAKAAEFLVLLHGLRHENLNPLIGCLAEPPRAALVSEWCARGSLQDVLQQDDIKLDWSFRLSLLTDLVRGMKYLHSTPIRVHGYLTSRNCVIDARWVLKVTDYGLPGFYEAQNIPVPEKCARDLLWTAPELLRHSSLRRKGTQPGDVYSFGIILQEVVVRGEPFCMLALTPEEIIEKVKSPPPLIRPSVSKGAAPPEAINIMRQCWAEQADMRPDFNAVHDQFKKLNHGRKVNIVDTMFQMLEKYSNNLEELIRERTEQLDIEKKKTEQLLNRMLPSPVAEKLKLGMPVDPEEFEEVTIYFSDIVGFTTISAYSTPFQVVDLLNDLYTCFDATINAYNVYKVETIGDAYMVVGGLPLRVEDHAEQIATMALHLLHESGRFRIRHLPGTPLRLRIGLHTGPCCAGVVGLTMPRYCLFGDTVNTASRMESTGAAWRIHLSETTKERLERAGGYQLEYRGPTEIKGKGTMNTYWLLGKAGFDKPLPVPPPIDLDESLIISKCMANSSNFKREPIEVNIDSHGVNADEAIVPKPPHPSFIKTMEHSKFSSLAKNQDESICGNGKIDFHMVKSTSSDTPMSLGTPVSASEVAAALLGASTSSLSGYRNRHRKIDEEDISTPYNHYKCLSPKQRVGKLLRRQFSLDRTEEGRCEEAASSLLPRLHKQNSAGAADLEKIEEIPAKAPCSSSPSSAAPTPIHCTLSISVDSLIH